MKDSTLSIIAGIILILMEIYLFGIVLNIDTSTKMEIIMKLLLLSALSLIFYVNIEIIYYGFKNEQI